MWILRKMRDYSWPNNNKRVLFFALDNHVVKTVFEKKYKRKQET